MTPEAEATPFWQRKNLLFPEKKGNLAADILECFCIPLKWKPSLENKAVYQRAGWTFITSSPLQIAFHLNDKWEDFFAAFDWQVGNWGWWGSTMTWTTTMMTTVWHCCLSLTIDMQQTYISISGIRWKPWSFDFQCRRSRYNPINVTALRQVTRSWWTLQIETVQTDWWNVGFIEKVSNVGDTSKRFQKSWVRQKLSDRQWTVLIQIVFSSYFGAFLRGHHRKQIAGWELPSDFTCEPL